jgi:sec-independent protein translocase protein TatC
MGDGKKKQKNEDLLLDSTMSLGDHLEELRMRMIRALVGLGIGLVIGLILGRSIISFMEGPYNDATATLLFTSKLDFQSDLDNGVIPEGLQQEFKDHGAALSPDVHVKQKGYLFSRNRWLIGGDPAKDRYCVKKEKGKLNVYKLISLQIIAVAAGFISYVKIGLIAGLIFSSPWVFYQLWMFVAAGLYPHEKRYVHLATPFSAGLFVTGALFFLLVVAPLTLKFLVKFNQKVLDVKSQFTFQHYISFVSQLMLVFGIAFQTPIAILFLNKTGLVSIEALRRSRKFVFAAVFIVAAMATPPDVISQVTLALPLYVLFELGILLSYFTGRKKEHKDN